MNNITSIYHTLDLKLLGDEGYYNAAEKFSAEDDSTILRFAAPLYQNANSSQKEYNGQYIKGLMLSEDPKEAISTVAGLMKGVNSRMTDIAKEQDEPYLPEEFYYLHDLYHGLRSVDFGSSHLNMAFLRLID